MNDSPIFALDIGTRSVVGLLLTPKEQGYTLLDIEMMEHEERSMLHGQIHHIPLVAKVISSIHKKLEARHGPLRSVCVAAAGRSLKTKRGKASVDISRKTLMTEQDVLHLELSAVQKAQFALVNEEENEEKHSDYHCVGYSTLHYHLDGEPIGSLIDQTGEEAAVEVIATFLPKVVIDSLMASLSRAGLELEALTLEPIAAINVLIPKSMRRLNVALVDIGAGTSDIAITDDNTVIAYGMVSTAGDVITEAISDEFLLDFHEAENVKRQLSNHEIDTITMTDVLGMETSLSKAEVLKTIHPAIEQLAKAISEEIRTLNAKPPKAVMLVGGGSLTPYISESIAKQLQLPSNRVAIRSIDAIKDLTIKDNVKVSPELVTPIGIGITAKESPIEYVSITVNQQVLRLFDVKELTVGDGLLAFGMDLKKLYGKPGMAMFVTVNGQRITLPGTHGEPPMIKKNGKPARLDDPLHARDVLEVKQGADGRPATATVGHLLEELPSVSLSVNGKKKILEAKITKNGIVVQKDEPIQDNDQIEVHFPTNIKEVLKEAALPFPTPFYVYVNDERITLPYEDWKIWKNGQIATLDISVQANDFIECKRIERAHPTVKDLLLKLNEPFEHSIDVFFNNKPVTLKKRAITITRNGVPLSFNEPLINGESLHMQKESPFEFIFQDVFREVQMNVDSTKKERFVMKKNGAPTTFTAPIQSGDKLEITFEPLHERKQTP